MLNAFSTLMSLIFVFGL